MRSMLSRALLCALVSCVVACEAKQGEAGKAGAMGAEGMTGMVGPAGPAGPQGEPGPVGPQGPAGPAGSGGGAELPPRWVLRDADGDVVPHAVTPGYQQPPAGGLGELAAPDTVSILYTDDGRALSGAKYRLDTGKLALNGRGHFFLTADCSDTPRILSVNVGEVMWIRGEVWTSGTSEGGALPAGTTLYALNAQEQCSMLEALGLNNPTTQEIGATRLWDRTPHPLEDFLNNPPYTLTIE
jgi:hypothetical protein